MSANERATKPVPEIDASLGPFFAAAKEGRLAVQRCSGCGALRFPPRELCNVCLATEATWVPVSGRGAIYSYNVMHQVYHPGFAHEVPYAVVMVKLAEGPTLISNLVDCPLEEIRIGMPVEVTFEQVSPEVTLPKFRRAQLPP